MTDAELLVERLDGVATLTLDRPQRRNALSATLVAALRSALAEVRDDPDVRVVVLTGAGERAFCAGADLDEMGTEALGAELAALFEDLWHLGKPTIAKVRGYALAGGMGLALTCDLVVASADAVFGTPEIDVGLWPFLVTVPLMRSMAPKKALELMMTGRRIDAAEADRLGFVTRVVRTDELDAAVDALATELAAKPPGVLRLGRDAFYAVWDLAADAALAHLTPLLGEAAAGDEAAEGIAAFTEKRTPSWRISDRPTPT